MEPRKVILGADSDDSTQRLLVTCFQSVLGEQVRVLEALDGRDVISLALRERPDLVVLSARLPERSGREVCRALKNEAETRDIGVMLLHGSPDLTALAQLAADALIE